MGQTLMAAAEVLNPVGVKSTRLSDRIAHAQDPIVRVHNIAAMSRAVYPAFHHFSCGRLTGRDILPRGRRPHKASLSHTVRRRAAVEAGVFEVII